MRCTSEGHDFVVIGTSTGRMSSKDPMAANPPRTGNEMSQQTHTVVVQFQQLSVGASRIATPARNLIDSYTSKQYYYLTHRADITVGDWVVVWSPIFDAPALCKVVEVLWNTKTAMAYKHIIDKVDFTEWHNEQQRIEAEQAEKRRRAKRINELNLEIAQARQRVEAQLIEERLRTDPNVQAAQAELNALMNMD